MSKIITENYVKKKLTMSLNRLFLINVLYAHQS